MKLSQDVAGVLSEATVDGMAVRLPARQLDRKLYVAVDKALQALGGKWNRSKKVHLFSSDPKAALESAVGDGSVVSAKDDLDFFESPPKVVAKLLELVDVEPCLTYLEPSAGKGAISRVLTGLPGATVDVCEVHPPFQDLLADSGLYRNVFRSDFLRVIPGVLYDRIVMNPPFLKDGGAGHVLRALESLASGGTLVSVMSSGVTFRTDKKTVAFRGALSLLGDYEFIDLPDKSFHESGTDVNAVILRLERR